jgi:hypothetical protein
VFEAAASRIRMPALPAAVTALSPPVTVETPLTNTVCADPRICSRIV